MTRTSLSRRWLDDRGTEWDLLRATKRYNTAYHTLRLLPGVPTAEPAIGRRQRDNDTGMYARTADR